MAFSDWESFSLGANFSVTAFLGDSFLGSPIVGSQSLSLKREGAGSDPGGVAVTPSSSNLTKGLTAARMRSQIKRVSGVSNIGNRVGIFFMTSDNDPLNGTPMAYSAGVDGTGRVFISKHTDAGISQEDENLELTSVLISDPTSLFTIDVMWFYDETEFSGTKIRVKIGTMADYSDLTLILDVTDNSSFPLSTTESEGLFHVTTGTGVDNEWIFDTTQLYSVTFT